jgi:polyhydroxybutyrate depolymerase
MKKIFTLLLSVLSVVAFSQSTVVDNFNWDGDFRSFRVRIPPAASSGDLLPLVINMHGFTSNGFQQEVLTDMNSVADSEDFFVVYPTGTFTFLFLRGWATELVGPAVDDIGFISALIDTLVAEYPIDPTRVYACGFSNGGGMSTTLACALSDKIYGFGINGAAVLNSNAGDCNPTTVRPMLSFHGTNDFIVPYAGTSDFAGAEQFIKAWAQILDDCSTPMIESLPDIAADGTTVDRVVWDNCSTGNQHWFYRINGGGHTWPGSPGAETTQDIDADVELWEFFKANGAEIRSGRTVSVEKLDLSPNPAQNLTLLQGLDGDWTAEIIDLSGRLVKAFQGSDLVAALDLSDVPNGLYVVRVQDDRGTRGSQLSVQH